jgi:RHS repeat-associated protein
LPYAPGGTVYWTENVYDAIGRTLQVKQPVIPGYAGSAGVTNYTYAGNTVTTTDAAGKWKRMESDAMGNLRYVSEPRPGGGADYVSEYVYSELGQLLTVTMSRPGKGTGNAATVTQTRSWAYNPTTQRLDSVTHPESGTTSYLYNLDGSVQRKTDAKGQYVEFAYDSEGRVTSARRYAGGGEDTCARVDYHYGSQSFDASFTANAAGRLAATATGVQTGMCQSVGAGQLIEMYSYTAAGAVTKKRMRIIRSGTTVDKDVNYTYGTDGKLATVLYPGASVPFTYSYDLMDRPVKMTGAPTFLGGTTVDLVKGVAYGVAGQVTTMQYMQWQDSGTPYYFTETRTYNELFQLKQQVTAGSVTAANIEYTYSNTGANNGRIVSRKNNERSGEQVSYTYDSLNRVTAASSTTGWTQSFDYDGFGNLWSQTMAGGSATPMSVNLDMLKNRINTAGWNYDNNGNTVAMPTSGGYAALEYDVDNRLTKWTGPVGEENYRYLPDNKRVWKKAPGGAETVYFYGAGGQKLITYTLQISPVALVSPVENVYFGGKLIRANGVSVVHDRLGSVVARGDSSSSVITKHDYLPYGEEMGTATGGNVDKFGTYLRDQTTGLDYADQRYFAGTGAGRFLSSDPYEASGGASEPGSWNRYPYVGGDPVNFRDKKGLFSRWAGDECEENCEEGEGGPPDEIPEPQCGPQSLRLRTNMMCAPPGTPQGAGGRGDAAGWGFVAGTRLRSLLLENKTCAGLFNPAAAGKTLASDAVGALWDALQSGGKTINGVLINKVVYDNLPRGHVVRDVSGGSRSLTLHLNRDTWLDGLSAGTVGDSGSGDFAMLLMVHEMGHVYDIVYGSNASKIITPDVVDFNDRASRENNYRVDQDCLGGRVGVPKP